MSIDALSPAIRMLQAKTEGHTHHLSEEEQQLISRVCQAAHVLSSQLPSLSESDRKLLVTPLSPHPSLTPLLHLFLKIQADTTSHSSSLSSTVPFDPDLSSINDRESPSIPISIPAQALPIALRPFLACSGDPTPLIQSLQQMSWWRRFWGGNRQIAHLSPLAPYLSSNDMAAVFQETASMWRGEREALVQHLIPLLQGVRADRRDVSLLIFQLKKFSRNKREQLLAHLSPLIRSTDLWKERFELVNKSALLLSLAPHRFSYFINTFSALAKRREEHSLSDILQQLDRKQLILEKLMSRRALALFSEREPNPLAVIPELEQLPEEECRLFLERVESRFASLGTRLEKEEYLKLALVLRNHPERWESAFSLSPWIEIGEGWNVYVHAWHCIPPGEEEMKRFLDYLKTFRGTSLHFYGRAIPFAAALYVLMPKEEHQALKHRITHYNTEEILAACRHSLHVACRQHLTTEQPLLSSVVSLIHYALKHSDHTQDKALVRQARARLKSQQISPSLIPHS